MTDGFSLVMLFAPRLQVEQSARRLVNSSFPPRLLSLRWPIWRRTLRPVYGSISLRLIPHIWQVKSLRSRTAARSFAEIRLNLTADLSGGASFRRYWPGLRPVLFLCVRIGQFSSSRSSRRRGAHSLTLVPAASRT